MVRKYILSRNINYKALSLGQKMMGASDGQEKNWAVKLAALLFLLGSFITSSFASRGGMDKPSTRPCDNGISNAPCTAVGLRTVIVAADGSGQYTEIQPALDAALPGDNILIKPGLYANTGTICGNPFITMQVSGTKQAPIYIGAYDHNNKPTLTVDFQVGCGSPVTGGQWVIVEGLNLTSKHSEGAGIRAFADHSTYRNNYVHHNKFQGMWQDGSHQLIELNIFEHNGNQGQGIGCMGPWEKPGERKWDPSHCHGIYGGVVYPTVPTHCRTPHHTTIRRNRFTSNSGSGYQMYISPSMCQDPTWGRKAHDYLIENNIIEDNGYGFFLVGLAQSTIRNNTIVSRTFPAQAANRTIGFIDWFDVPSTTKIYNNLFYSSITEPTGPTLYLMSNQQSSDNHLMIDYNGYFVKSDARFRGSFDGSFQAYRSFLTQWRSVTGKDTNGFVHDVDAVSPGFVSLERGDYHLTVGAPAINKGDPSNCPATDFDGNLRVNRCDMGAFEK